MYAGCYSHIVVIFIFSDSWASNDEGCSDPDKRFEELHRVLAIGFRNSKKGGSRQ